MSILGSEKRKFIFSCRGTLPHSEVREFATEFIKMAGMTPARQGRTKDVYPYKDGGGVGYTGFFPLMESYLVIDVYDDLNEIEILLSSCKPERINLEQLKNFLSCKIGPVEEVGVI